MSEGLLLAGLPGKDNDNGKTILGE